jgi:ABC-2 type transport system permease protein
MIRRWLKILRAEAYRDLITSLRYPVEMVTGLLILYMFFMGLYTGARMLAGQQGVLAGHDGMVVAFTLWFFAIMAINTMSVDIESEARQGTLEQVYLHAPNYLGLLWLRAVVHLAYGAWMVIALSLLIQLTTGRWLHLGLDGLPVLIAAALLGVAGLCGVGLLLGALSLVFKRIGQLSAIVQFGLFFLAFVQLKDLPPMWQAILPHLPLTGAVQIVIALITPGTDPAFFALRLLWLAVDSAVYALLGSLVFLWAEKQARKAGSLSHY